MRLGFVLILLFPLALGPVLAQDAQRIAAVVNDKAVSTFDLIERIELVIGTTGLEDSPASRERIRAQVLRTLIDEQLELQEAERLGIEVTEADVQVALRYLERQNDIPEGRMIEALEARGVPGAALLKQIDAELKWSRVVRSRLRTVTITDAAVDEVLARLEASRGRPEVRLAEIVLAVDDPSQDAEVAANARRLVDEIRRGANFGAVARQFSQAASARTSGDIGWTLVDQLPLEVQSAVADAPEGSLVGPVATRGGHTVLLVLGRRKALEPDPGAARLDLELIALPLPDVSTQEQEDEQTRRAEQAAERVTGCDDAEAAAEATPTALHRDLGTFQLRDLVPELRLAAADLAAGDVSRPVIAGGIVNVLIVCSRTDPSGALPSRKEVRDSLLDQRLELIARGYLRDLRRVAFVDIRL
ncbi:MAG: peptidylprolyl isomerase [Alphaproteobacteria bacterium]